MSGNPYAQWAPAPVVNGSSDNPYAAMAQIAGTAPAPAIRTQTQPAPSAPAPDQSTWGGTALSLAQGVPQGIAGMVGFPGAMRDVLSGVAEHFIPQPDGQPNYQPSQQQQDLGVTIRHAIEPFLPKPAVDYLEARANRTPDQRAQQQTYARTMAPLDSPGATASPADWNDLFQGYGAMPYHKPQGAAERLASNVGQMAPMALMPGTAMMKAARVGLPAVGATAGGEISNQNPWAIMLGGLLGGGAAGAIDSIANAPYQRLGEMAKQVGPGDLEQAIQLAQDARALPGGGIKLTPTEAMAHITPKGASARVLANYVENSAPVVREGQLPSFFAERPDQVRNTVTGVANQIAPPIATPSMVGVNAQAEAGGALNQVRQGINAQAKPFYDALQGQEMPAAQYEALSQGPSYQRALNSLRGDPELNAGIAHLPDNNLSVVNEVQKRLGILADQAAGSPMAPGDRYLAAIRSGAGTQTDALARAASEPMGGQYGTARDIVSALSQQNLTPLEAGPLGQISSSPKLAEQVGSLFPQKPFPGQAQETTTALQHLPENGPQLVRQYLLQALNASQGAPSGAEFIGSRLAQKIAGNPESTAALSGAVDTVAPHVSTDAQTLVDALKATGQRLPANSATALRGELRDAFSHAPIGVDQITRLADPLEWGQVLNKAAGGAMWRHQMGTLAEILQSDPSTWAATFDRARAAQPASNQLAAALSAAATTSGQK